MAKKKKSCCINALLFLSCVVLPSCSHVDSSDNSVVVDPLIIEPNVLDFGRVCEADNPLKLEFTLANQGTVPIEITGLRSGCGCTVADVSESKLLPGKRVGVLVSIRTRERCGHFTNRILIDVAGRSEPVSILIEGDIVRDIWCNDLPIRCSVEASRPIVEGTFDVHTVDWPSVGFDLTALDKGIAVQEISRSTIEGETIIKFRFRMETLVDRYVNSRHIKLKPLDERIHPLIVPITCYRPDLKSDTLTSSHSLRPERISLGIIPPGEDRQFRVFGNEKLINSLVVAKLDHIPKGLSVTLNRANDEKGKDSCEVTIHVNKDVPAGLVDGRIHLASSNGHKYSIAVLGMIGQSRVGKKSD